MSRLPTWGLGPAVIGLLVVLGSPSHAAGQSVSYNGSVSYSRGAYIFDQTTHSIWFSNGLSMRAGRFTLSATLPVVIQNSAVISFVGGQPLPTGGEDAGVVRSRRGGEVIGTRGRHGQGGAPESEAAALPYGSVLDEVGDSATVVFRDTFETEIGDPMLSTSLTLHSGEGLLRSVGASLSAKAPVRSIESGVGTGAWDVGAGLSAVLGRGATLGFIDVSYWSFGDLPELELDPVWAWSASLSRSVRAGRTAVSASFTGSTPFVPSVDAPMSVGLAVLFLTDSRRILSFTAAAGLTESAPDLSVSVGWSVPFD